MKQLFSNLIFPTINCFQINNGSGISNKNANEYTFLFRERNNLIM